MTDTLEYLIRKYNGMSEEKRRCSRIENLMELCMMVYLIAKKDGKDS